jgi:hypothetical protein
MRKIIFSSIIGLTLILSGCESNFDPQIYGSLFSNNFPKTEADCESYLMSCYLPFMNAWNYNYGGANQQGFYLPTGGIIRMFDSPSDVGNPCTIGSWGGTWLEFSQANFNRCVLFSRGFSDSNTNHFEKIREITRFTQVLGMLESMDPNILSDEKKKQFTGEIRLLRGLMMYYLLHIYGPVPVILDPTLVGNFEAESNLVRPTLDQMVKYIYDDFDYARQNMTNTAPRGRYTADYATFCLMKHCLNEGDYDKAIAMYEALKATGKYSLFTTGGTTAYANQFKIANEWNSEVIMALSVSAAGNGDPDKGDFNPIWLYLMPNSVLKTATWPNGKANPFAAYPGQAWGHIYNVSPAFYDTYEADDARKNVIVTEAYQSNGTLRTREDCMVSWWSGFILNKYPIEINQQFQPTDIPLARWADVLLMYAEAVARKTKAVPTGEAMEGVTAVRARAGLAPLSGDAIATYDGFMEALLMERGHEFLYEGQRKIDLIRFNKFRHNVKKYKANLDPSFPTHQYMPLPNYAVNQATEYGKTLTQFFERPGYDLDN